MADFAPCGVLDSPSGFFAELARGPDAPVTSLIELPYSRIASPQPRDVFARLPVYQHMSSLATGEGTYLEPAPLPAPDTPFPAADTTAPVKLPMPDAAWLPMRASQPCCWGAGFFATWGLAFGSAFVCPCGLAFGRAFV
jgi:hypothetical protein